MATRTQTRQRKTTSTRQRSSERRRTGRWSLLARSAPKGSARTRSSEQAHNIYLVGLRNAHALEKQALEIMERQVGRLTHYPNLAKRLRTHIRETKGATAPA